MKSRYTPMVKVKKSSVDTIESRLFLCNSKITQVKVDIASLNDELNRVVEPTSGTFAKIRQQQLIKHTLRQQVNLLELRLLELRSEQESLKKLFKNAYIEYEKFKYLETNEMEKAMEKAKKEESMLLDEVAIMGYNIREKGSE